MYPTRRWTARKAMVFSEDAGRAPQRTIHRLRYPRDTRFPVHGTPMAEAVGGGSAALSIERVRATGQTWPRGGLGLRDERTRGVLDSCRGRVRITEESFARCRYTHTSRQEISSHTSRSRYFKGAEAMARARSSITVGVNGACRFRRACMDRHIHPYRLEMLVMSGRVLDYPSTQDMHSISRKCDVRRNYIGRFLITRAGVHRKNPVGSPWR